MCEVLWGEEKGRVEKISFGLLIQKVGFGETLLLDTCGKLSFGGRKCSKNEICSEVGLVGVGRGGGESWRKYLLDCPKK